MKKIINKNSKRLVFPKIDFSIDTNEEKKVSDEQYEILIYNKWIEDSSKKINESPAINKSEEFINKRSKKEQV